MCLLLTKESLLDWLEPTPRGRGLVWFCFCLFHSFPVYSASSLSRWQPGQHGQEAPSKINKQPLILTATPCALNTDSQCPCEPGKSFKSPLKGKAANHLRAPLKRIPMFEPKCHIKLKEGGGGEEGKANKLHSQSLMQLKCHSHGG